MPALRRHDGVQPHDLAQAPLDAIALDGIADFFRYREAKTSRCGVAALARLQHKSRRRSFGARGSGEEVSTSLQPLHGSAVRRRQALRRLRPRARRAAMTLRPPTVAVRARKP